MGAAELLPYACVLAAGGACWRAATTPTGGAGRALRATALVTLAGTAFLRGSAPSALAAALLLSAIAQAIPPRGGGNWSSGSVLAAAAACVAFAYLFVRAGLGRAAISDVGHLLPILAAAVAGAALTMRLLRRRAPVRIGGAIAATAMLVSALTLPFSLWIAVGGTAAVFVAEALALLATEANGAAADRRGALAYWVLSFLGQAAVVYAFLR